MYVYECMHACTYVCMYAALIAIASIRIRKRRHAHNQSCLFFNVFQCCMPRLWRRSYRERRIAVKECRRRRQMLLVAFEGAFEATGGRSKDFRGFMMLVLILTVSGSGSLMSWVFVLSSSSFGSGQIVAGSEEAVGPVIRTTMVSIVVCASSLAAWAGS